MFFDFMFTISDINLFMSVDYCWSSLEQLEQWISTLLICLKVFIKWRVKCYYVSTYFKLGTEKVLQEFSGATNLLSMT